jgi:SNF2 family DNA or RNA helicase
MTTPVLYPYQRQAALDIASSRKPMLNAFDPGLGKSRVALTVIAARNDRRVLIVCPHSVILVWLAEVDKWWKQAPPVTVVQRGLLIPEGEGIFLLSYGLLSEASGRVAARLANTGPFDATILDEAHYLKNAKSNRASRIFALLPRLGWVHPMTGTPAPNHAGELWGLLYHLRPDLIVSPITGKPMREGEFQSRYCNIRHLSVNGRKIEHIEGSKNKDELRARITPMVIAARKKEVLPQLPPIDFVVLPVQVPRGVLAIGGSGWDRVDDDALLQQLAAGQAKSEIQQLGLAKIPSVIEWIVDLLDNSRDRRLVVWCVHHKVIDRYVDLLGEYKPVKFDGRDTLDQRRAAIQRFMSGDAKIFVGQIQAGGTGLTLVSPTAKCSDVVFAEASFSYADNVQAACRIHRIGQNDGVLCRYASAAGTLDDRIQDILARKSRDWADLFS